MSCQLRFSLHKSVKKTFVSSNLPSTGHDISCPYSEKSDAAALRRTAAVVRNRRDVANHHNVQTRSGQSAHGGFAAGTRPLNADFNALHPVLVARSGCRRKRGLLRRVRSALARTLEPDCAGGRPAQGAAVRIRDGDLRVVERRGDVRHAVRHDALLALLLELFFALSRRSTSRRFSWCLCRVLRCLLLFSHVLLRSARY